MRSGPRVLENLIASAVQRWTAADCRRC